MYPYWLDRVVERGQNSCPIEHLVAMLEGYLSLNYDKIDPHNSMTVSGKVRATCIKGLFAPPPLRLKYKKMFLLVYKNNNQSAKGSNNFDRCYGNKNDRQIG